MFQTWCWSVGVDGGRSIIMIYKFKLFIGNIYGRELVVSIKVVFQQFSFLWSPTHKVICNFSKEITLINHTVVNLSLTIFNESEFTANSNIFFLSVVNFAYLGCLDLE